MTGVRILIQVSLGCLAFLAAARSAWGSGHTLFVNFDGAVVRGGGCSVDPSGCSPLVRCTAEATIPGYLGDEEARGQVLWHLQSWLSPFDVRVVDGVPTVPHTMCVVGGNVEALCRAGETTLGLAPLDCSNASGEDIVFAFPERLGPPLLAEVVAQESAHAWGLEHTEDPRDLMHPSIGNARTFVDEDLAIVGGSVCAPGRTQNSFRRLRELFGPSPPDAEAPRLQILDPAPGARLERQRFVVRVRATDDKLLDAIDYYVDGVLVEHTSGPPRFTLDLRLTAGGHAVRVDAIDHAGHTASRTIDVVTPDLPVVGPDDGSASSVGGSNRGSGSTGCSLCSARGSSAGPLLVYAIWLFVRSRSSRRTVGARRSEERPLLS